MKNYTVVMKRPAYMDMDEQDTYTALVRAKTQADAIRQARTEAYQADKKDCPDSKAKVDDYLFLLMFAGHHAPIAGPWI